VFFTKRNSGPCGRKAEDSYEYLNIESIAIGEKEKLIILYFEVCRSACLDIEA
jgi:hypothetical protein